MWLEKAQMKNPMFVTVIIPVVIALAIQACMMFQLTKQVNQLSARISPPGSQKLEKPNFPIFTPAKPGCDSDVFEGQRESL